MVPAGHDHHPFLPAVRWVLIPVAERASTWMQERKPMSSQCNMEHPTLRIVSELETASRKRNNAPKSRALAARTCTPV
eukprot:CAMPEP_0181449286 /NCGR_PEP_ID=MMETSP1110-20121109/27579_1 /TAXON_ID=174948 /ORGANISM="Symbiodinium sp., Strain CCMP421" /LENGTH=77 /DNA_ID=CAMNT_0023573465 /DNA_START=303 /DNA_END=536 /DNA_ORIENTATION=+